jgi:hypothetical protein
MFYCQKIGTVPYLANIGQDSVLPERGVVVVGGLAVDVRAPRNEELHRAQVTRPGSLWS